MVHNCQSGSCFDFALLVEQLFATSWGGKNRPTIFDSFECALTVPASDEGSL